MIVNRYGRRAAFVVLALALAGPAAASDVSPSFSGHGRELAFGETDDALANMSARDSAVTLQRLRRELPKPAPQETIFGADQRRRINPTTTFPARATVHIVYKVGQSLRSCSGFLISKNTVVTSGSCVAASGSGKYYPVATYDVFPGNNGHAPPPYGSCQAKKLYATAGWLRSGLQEHDYGAIKLKCNIGTTTGFYGLTVNGWEKGTAVTVQGYPLDKGEFTQWSAPDMVRNLDDGLVFHQADTYFGQEGSPVWFRKSAACKNCVIAIHVMGKEGTVAPGSRNNRATRITADVLENLTKWKNAP